MRAIEQEKAKRLLEMHLAQPEVSTEDYLRRLTSELGESVCRRKKLYLDTRYWVFLRDAAIGRAKRPEHESILRLLRELVRDGSVICPVSDVAFMELTTQSDDVTRVATGQLWDELSLGVALVAERYRIRSELESFFRFPEEDRSSDSVCTQIWTRAGYVLGPLVPLNEVVPAARLRAIQKASIDACWETTFAELAADSAAHLSAAERFDETAGQINVETRRFQHEVPSFGRALIAECLGALRIHQHDISQILIKIFEERGGALEEETKSQFIELREKMIRGLVNGFRYAKIKMAARLPSLYIHSACHAAIRMDVKRKFNGNFLRDLLHGAAGGGYHDAMFTERPLQVLLTSGNVAVDKIFGSKVFSKEEDVLSYLMALAQQV